MLNSITRSYPMFTGILRGMRSEKGNTFAKYWKPQSRIEKVIKWKLRNRLRWASFSFYHQPNLAGIEVSRSELPSKTRKRYCEVKSSSISMKIGTGIPKMPHNPEMQFFQRKYDWFLPKSLTSIMCVKDRWYTVTTWYITGMYLYGERDRYHVFKTSLLSSPYVAERYHSECHTISYQVTARRPGEPLESRHFGSRIWTQSPTVQLLHNKSWSLCATSWSVSWEAQARCRWIISWLGASGCNKEWKNDVAREMNFLVRSLMRERTRGLLAEKSE